MTEARNLPQDVPAACHRVAALVLGISSGLYIHIVGEVFISEIVVVALTPACLLGWNRSGSMSERARSTLVALTAWLVGLVLSMVLVGSSVSASAADIAGAVLTIISVYVLMRAFHTLGEISWLATGVGIGQILAVELQTSPYAAVNAWKFGGGIGVSLIIVSVDRRGTFSRLALVVLGVISLLLDTRSLALIALATLALGTITDLWGRRLGRGALLLVFGVVVLGLGAAVSAGYSFVIRSGLLGANANLKFEAQGHGSPLLVLLGGRDEIFFSLRAIAHHPLVGLGPHPILSLADSAAGLQQMAELGLRPATPTLDTAGSVLPVHSYLIGGWVHAGVLGLIAWLLVFWLIMSRLLAVALVATEYRYLGLFLGVLGLWNILYSPYGGGQRFQLALSVLVLSALAGPQLGRKRRKADAENGAIRSGAAMGAARHLHREHKYEPAE